MLLLVQNGSIWFQNNTKYENGQNSPKQSWENNLIFEYIWIFWTNIFIRKNIRCFFIGEFIRIFILDIFIMPNIFRYSFVQYLWWIIYLDIHLYKNLILVPHWIVPLAKRNPFSDKGILGSYGLALPVVWDSWASP